MTVNEYLKKHTPSQVTLDLIEELKNYSTEDEYVLGVLADCETAPDKEELLDYIQHGSDVSYENIILYALDKRENF